MMETLVAVDEKSEVVLQAAQGQPASSIRKFTMVAYNGGRLHVAAFPHPAVIDLKGLKIEQQAYPTFLQHDRNQRVGHTTNVEIEGNRIVANGVFSGANTHSKTVLTESINGFPWEASIGLKYELSDVMFVVSGGTVTVNGRTFRGPVHVVKASALTEISFVSIGADEDGTSARLAASATHRGATMPTGKTRSSIQLTQHITQHTQLTGQRERNRHAVGFLIASGLNPRLMKCQFPFDLNASHDLGSIGYQKGSNFADIGRTYLSSTGEPVRNKTGRCCLEAAMSSIGLPEGVGDAINFALIDHFKTTPDSLKGIRKESVLGDYRINERSRLKNIGAMEDLPAGGHAKDVSANMETTETFRGRRKALVGKIDEQDSYNFPWLLPEIAKLGAISARNFLMAMSWKPMLANDDLADGTPFFDASRGNTADQVLNEANLASTIAAMNVQQENGESTGHRGRYLVVAEALLLTARKLARSVKLGDGSDLIVRSDPRIDTGMIDPMTGVTIAGDASRWFVFSELMAPVEVSLMTPEPSVNTWKLSEGEWGLGWAMQWSIGCVGVDPCAAFRRQSP